MAIGGNVIERRSVDDVVEVVEARMRTRSGRSLAVGSVNLDHLHHFGDESALNRQPGPEWLLLADGMPIAWRGQLLTAAPWPRVTGADLLPRVLELAQRSGYRVGFLGGTADTHLRLTELLRQRFPDLVVSGTWAPEADQVAQVSPHIAAAIRLARTDILVVCLGKPRQERWVVEHGTATGAHLFLPFGAAADFLAGTKRRAPQWMQRAGLEWLYRLSREPRRLARRYLIQGPAALIMAMRAHAVYAPGTYYVAPAEGGPVRYAPPRAESVEDRLPAVGADRAS
ncbi:WecB/TagA/CpsF family glycosyltransferase [Mycobacterium sp. IDR2000157661]|nr:WecB/TagA/CpsF family glycosyltransferase [Mycobacterium sp. IDR2000157661]